MQKPANSAQQKRTTGGAFIDLGFEEAIVPAVWSRATFERKAATPEIMGQMWTFQDKGARDVCLIPEATALFQEMVQAGEIKGERRLFYVARCYRYERPQAGRYREFTQLGVEILNPKNGPKKASDESLIAAKLAMQALGVNPESMEWNGLASRGLGYYLDGLGFEGRAPQLSAQAQVVGGGAYAEGAGFAIGLERALLARSKV